MGNTRNERYSDDVLKKVQKTWMRYKEDANTSQAKTAKALNMNQSAFSQYVRGEIPLNTDFLVKFGALTKTSMKDFGIDKVASRVEPKAYTIPIKYTLTGAPAPSNRVTISSVVPTDKCVGLLIDAHDHYMPFGTIAIVDPDAECKNHDLVVLTKVGDSTPVFGRLQFERNRWRVVTPVWGGHRSFDVAKRDKVYRISGAYIPENEGKVLNR